jgi:hypothetical protein
MNGSLMVIQCFTRSPKRSNSSEAYATKSGTMRSVLSSPPYAASSADGRSQWKSVRTGWMPSASSASMRSE